MLKVFRCRAGCSVTFILEEIKEKMPPFCGVCKQLMGFYGHADKEVFEKVTDLVAADVDSNCAHCGILLHGDRKFCRDCEILQRVDQRHHEQG